MQMEQTYFLKLAFYIHRLKTKIKNNEIYS